MVKKEVLVIVAHPDDETIWLGGTLLKDNSNKTIICLCRKKDEDRYPKFKKVCKILKSKGYISDLDDSEKGYYKKISKKEIINRILKITKNKKYDTLYTHGKNGEYGHIRHIEVYNSVNEMLNKKLLYAKDVFYFSYIKKVNKKKIKSCNINSSADKLIRLEKPYFKMKKKLIQEVYGFKKGSFEEKSCRDREALDIKK
jgi:LmbE family N-acetylglucosaminyl deacetylase